jgi:hypothetical protein
VHAAALQRMVSPAGIAKPSSTSTMRITSPSMMWVCSSTRSATSEAAATAGRLRAGVHDLHEGGARSGHRARGAGVGVVDHHLGGGQGRQERAGARQKCGFQGHVWSPFVLREDGVGGDVRPREAGCGPCHPCARRGGRAREAWRRVGLDRGAAARAGPGTSAIAPKTQSRQGSGVSSTGSPPPSKSGRPSAAITTV